MLLLKHIDTNILTTYHLLLSHAICLGSFQTGSEVFTIHFQLLYFLLLFLHVCDRINQINEVVSYDQRAFTTEKRIQVQN